MRTSTTCLALIGGHPQPPARTRTFSFPAEKSEHTSPYFLFFVFKRYAGMEKDTQKAGWGRQKRLLFSLPSSHGMPYTE